MIYIYDYNSHELVGQYKSAGRAALGLGYTHVQVVQYNRDRVTKGHPAAVIHRKKGIAVFILSHKFVMKSSRLNF